MARAIGCTPSGPTILCACSLRFSTRRNGRQREEAAKEKKKRRKGGAEKAAAEYGLWVRKGGGRGEPRCAACRQRLLACSTEESA